MRKKLLFVLCLSAFVLSACSLRGDTSDYDDYLKLYDGGKLDPLGYYSPEVFAGELHLDHSGDRPESAAYFILSDNNRLNLELYKDKEKKSRILAAEFYLNPGEKLYADFAPAASFEEYSQWGLRITAADGEKDSEATLYSPDSSGFVLEVTDDMAGQDYLIYPLGQYGTRQITFRDYVTDDKGKESKLSGEWFVDSLPVSGKKALLDPLTSHIITYRFDANKYFYISSSPKALYVSNEEGVVVFDEQNSFDDFSQYSIELKKYYTVQVNTSETRLVRCNGSADQKVRSGKNFIINNLKYGDTVTIVTNKRWPELESCAKLKGKSPEEQGPASFLYTLTACQPGAEFEFTPSAFTFKRGKITFTVFGEEITSTRYLAPGTRIYYEQKSAEEGYHLPTGVGYITVSDNETTGFEIKKLKFVRDSAVTLLLPQPPYGGNIEYYVDNRIIIGDTYESDDGGSVSVKYLPKDGWTVNPDCADSYILTDEKLQTISLGVDDLSDIFIESEEHKPKLIVTLDKSVPGDDLFDISASGTEVCLDRSFNDGSIRNGKSIIVDGSAVIPTHGAVEINAKNISAETGTALKFNISLTGKNKNDSVEYYILKSNPAVIDLYSFPGTNENARFTSVNIYVEQVAVEPFVVPSSGSSTIEVRNLKTNELLKNGDVIEPKETVLVSLYPGQGRELTGKGIVNGVFRQSMSYEKYLANIADIISRHPSVQVGKAALEGGQND